MAKYKKRPDGRYMVNIYSHTDAETGIRKYVSVYARSIPKLENKAAETRDQINKGIYADDRGYTVAAWSNEWLVTERTNGEIRTRQMYERLVNKHIIPSIGDIRLKNLKKADIQRMINERSKHPRTCEQIKMCTHQILESAIDNGLLYKNVCRGLNMPVYIKKPKRPLTDTEKKAILTADFTDKQKAFVTIIQYCGLRMGETLALSRGDFDFIENTVTVNNVIVFAGSEAVFKPYPKSKSGFRTVPLPQNAAIFLQKYILSLDGLYLFQMERKPGFMTESSYKKFWKNIINKINTAAGGTNELQVIHGLTAHIFRHNYATMLYYAGVPAKEAQYLLGHSDLKLTLDVYTHLDKSRLTARSKLEKFLEAESF